MAVVVQIRRGVVERGGRSDQSRSRKIKATRAAGRKGWGSCTASRVYPSVEVVQVVSPFEKKREGSAWGFV